MGQRPGPDPVRLRGAMRQVLHMLTDAAERGLPAPSSLAIAAQLGWKGRSGPSAVVTRLEKAGLITVERYARARVITIVATGKRTAPQIGTAHVAGREDELAELVSQGKSIWDSAAALGIGTSSAWALWRRIREGLGWQAR